MFTEAFEKTAGPIGKAINKVVKDLQLGKKGQKVMRSRVAKGIKEHRNFRRSWYSRGWPENTPDSIYGMGKKRSSTKNLELMKGMLVEFDNGIPRKGSADATVTGLNQFKNRGEIVNKRRVINSQDFTPPKRFGLGGKK